MQPCLILLEDDVRQSSYVEHYNYLYLYGYKNTALKTETLLKRRHCDSPESSFVLKYTEVALPLYAALLRKTEVMISLLTFQAASNVVMSHDRILDVLWKRTDHPTCRLVQVFAVWQKHWICLVQQYRRSCDHAHDFETRHLFSLQFLARFEVDPEWPLNIFWTDEAHFHLDSFVNSHNCRIWETDNPHSTFQVPLHSPKVTVWCGFPASLIRCPYFFEELGAGGPVTCSIARQRYALILRDKIIPDLQARQCLSGIIFMQDGAPPRITRCVKDVLKHHFTEERGISHQFHHLYPPRLPDLNPCDFWLLGPFKTAVLWSDECQFSRQGTIITHNTHYWSLEIPYLLRPNHHQVRWSVNVWCGIWKSTLIGPMYCDGPLTSESYTEILSGPLAGFLEDKVSLRDLSRMRYQYDGATTDKFTQPITFLTQTLVTRRIGYGGQKEWSPDHQT
ncbi:uncharacterized protein TNCV_3443981 [Trichonephila clavipes]|nr:uncharacterized protein TNCV_3443981 [Trichonephila clavipes]